MPTKYMPHLVFLPALFFFLHFSAGAVAAQSYSGKVLSVLDGDTIRVDKRGQAQKIHLFGIDCPEKGQPFGPKAKKYVGSHAYRKIVRVNYKGRDAYGVVLANVVLPDGRVLNHELLREGLAWWNKEQAPKASELSNLEVQARSLKRGLWSQDKPVAPWEFRKGKANKAGPVKPSGVSSIVGARDTRLYYRPGCPGYERIFAKNRVYFETERQAQRSGYRAARGCPRKR